MSNTIFELNESGILPSINKGMTELRYQQVESQTSLGSNGTAIGGSRFDFRFQLGSDEYWVPSKSYLRMRIKIGGAADAHLTAVDGIAPAMDQAANMFASGQLKLGSVELSQIQADMGPISILNTRMSREKGFLDGAGSSLAWLDPSLDSRIADVSVDGSRYETINRVALGFDAATNTIEIATGAINAGTAVFAVAAGAALPTLSTYWKAGDTLVTSINNKYIVKTVGATTLTLFGKVVVEAAAAGEFARERGNLSNHEPRRVQFYELIWIPPLSIFKIDHALPLGDYRLILTTQGGSDYKVRAIESKVAKTAVTDFQITVEDMNFYVAGMTGPRIDNLKYYLDLDETHMDQESMTTASGSEIFSVNPNTYALTVAFQNNNAGSDSTLSPTRFRVKNANGSDGAELALTSLQVQYAGFSKPMPSADPSFTLNSKDYTSARYADSMLYNMMYFIEPESLEDWQNRGMYIYLPFPTDADKQATRVIVRYTFGAAFVSSQLLLFSHYKRMATIEIKDGKVVFANVEDR